MRYTTVTLGFVEGHETEGINAAIEQGLKELSEEINGPAELVNVAYVVIGEKLYVTVLAKPYEPQDTVGILQALKALKSYAPETTRGIVMPPQYPEALKGLLGE